MGLESTMQNGKDTVYVDVDDEITTVIDKVTGSKQKIVALVLPKRASVFQSVVNMKLLKRNAEAAGKSIVLITSEASLLPLAGVVGLYVAKTPQSKPEIPQSPTVHDGTEIDDDDTIALDDEVTAETDGDKSIGDLAKGAALGATVGLAVSGTDEADPPVNSQNKSGKNKKAKQPKVPSFSKFQKRLFLGIAVTILLVIGWYYATRIMPTATIIIGTDATDYNSSLEITLDTSADKVDVAKSTVPAQMVNQQQTYTGQATATGQKNNGEKAVGEVDMSVTKCAPNLGAPSSVAAGTGINRNGLTYLTQESASFSFDHFQGGSCAVYEADNISITAQNGGANYNTNSDSFTVSGRSDITATGSASGGTDDIIKVVSQADIDSAQGKISKADSETIKNQLKTQLEQNNLYPLIQTFSDGDPVATNSVPVGAQAESVTVTEKVSYSMFGVKRDYLDQLIREDIKTQIDPATQTIINDGLDKAVIKVVKCDDKTCQITLETTATVGPQINSEQLKEQVKGKKAGYVKSDIGNLPGVTDVQVNLSPFWVSSVPNNTEKITIKVGKTSGSDGS